jgi:hypothetical protein
MFSWLAMGWRHVCFANWPVEPDVVDARLPDALTVDTYDGQGWLSVVPFTNVHVRPHQLPAKLGFRLPELNLRTYVTHDGERGVYFFSLDADGILGVTGARLFHHLPYYYATIDLEEQGERIRFTSTRTHPGARPAEFRATYEPTGDRFIAESGSLDEFLTRRDRYYTQASDGQLRAANVTHEPWPLYEASVDIERNTLFAANGFDTPETAPVHLYSPAVETVASANYRV